MGIVEAWKKTWTTDNTLAVEGKWPGAVYNYTYDTEKFDSLGTDQTATSIKAWATHRIYTSSSKTTIQHEEHIWQNTIPMNPYELRAVDEDGVMQNSVWFEGNVPQDPGLDSARNIHLRWLRGIPAPLDQRRMNPEDLKYNQYSVEIYETSGSPPMPVMGTSVWNKTDDSINPSKPLSNGPYDPYNSNTYLQCDYDAASGKLLPNRTYFWRVKVRKEGDGSESSWSPLYFLKTKQ
jgi:hypothetical protein